MEALGFLFDLTCCFLEFADVGAIVADLVAWRKSGANRAARKQAKQRGDEAPPLDFWFWLFVVLTPVSMALTAIVVWKWLRGP